MLVKDNFRVRQTHAETGREVEVSIGDVDVDVDGENRVSVFLIFVGRFLLRTDLSCEKDFVNLKEVLGFL